MEPLRTVITRLFADCHDNVPMVRYSVVVDVAVLPDDSHHFLIMILLLE